MSIELRTVGFRSAFSDRCRVFFLSVLKRGQAGRKKKYKIQSVYESNVVVGRRLEVIFCVVFGRLIVRSVGIWDGEKVVIGACAVGKSWRRRVGSTR